MDIEHWLPVHYPNYFSRKRPFHSELTPEEFRALRSRGVSGYFSEIPPRTVSAAEGVTQSLALDGGEVARFEADFGRLLSHRKDLQGLSRARSFSHWWDEHKAAYLTRPVIEGYRKSALTVGELLDDLHLHFIVSQNARMEGSRLFRTIRKVIKNKYVVTGAFSLGMLATKSAGFLSSLAVLGPGVQMVNSYTQAVVTPLAQTAQQKGSQDLGPIAARIQTWLTNRKDLEHTRQGLHETTDKLQHTDFSKLNPGQAQAKWADFEQSYFKLFLNYNQTLPSHLRDGRGMLKDWLVSVQLGVANNLSTFDNQYWTHAGQLDRLREQVRAHGGKPSRKERELIGLHQEEMKAAQDRIAGALAAWKLYDYMYPEYSGSQKKQIEEIYHSFARSMRYDVYVKHFAARMQEVLAQMDADFLAEDKLAQAG